MRQDASTRVHGDVSPDLTVLSETFVAFISIFTRLCCEHEGDIKRFLLSKGKINDARSKSVRKFVTLLSLSLSLLAFLNYVQTIRLAILKKFL